MIRHFNDYPPLRPQGSRNLGMATPNRICVSRGIVRPFSKTRNFWLFSGDLRYHHSPEWTTVRRNKNGNNKQHRICFQIEQGKCVWPEPCICGVPTAAVDIGACMIRDEKRKFTDPRIYLRYINTRLPSVLRRAQARTNRDREPEVRATRERCGYPTITDPFSTSRRANHWRVRPLTTSRRPRGLSRRSKPIATLNQPLALRSNRQRGKGTTNTR